jgi:tRNA uridine 5-carboxymethylaminomethyl modification enzyme
MKKNEDRQIPDDFNYDKIDSFSSETKQRLKEVRPQTIGQASRVHAIKPSDIAILTICLEKQKKERKQRKLEK